MINIVIEIRREGGKEVGRQERGKEGGKGGEKEKRGLRKEEEQEEGREEERKIKRERRSYLERVDKTFWGRGVLETKTENELKHGPLFYS